jgi:hypothetical protein
VKIHFIIFYVVLSMALFDATARADELRVNQVLSLNQRLYSENHNYFAIMQSDGNLVVYKNDGSGRSLWSTQTAGSGAIKAVMQNDGNFVLYNAQMHPVWATYKYGSNNVFYVDNSGFARVETARKRFDSYSGSGVYPSGVTPTVFSHGFHFEPGVSYPSASSLYRIVFQSDGNLVVYGPSGSAAWNSKTNGKGGKTALVSGDFIYMFNSAPDVIWQTPINVSQTSVPGAIGSGASYFILMPDGDLQGWSAVIIWMASGGDPRPAPGGDGPACYGPPEGCIPSPIPIYTVNY